jgi:hypothetical protein
MEDVFTSPILPILELKNKTNVTFYVNAGKVTGSEF